MEGAGGGSSSGDPDGFRRHPKGFDDGDAFMKKMRKQMMEKRRALEKKAADGDNHHVDFEADKEEEEEGAGGGGDEGTGWKGGGANDDTEKEKARKKAIKERAKEYETLREELKSKHRAARVMTGQERVTYDAVSFGIQRVDLNPFYQWNWDPTHVPSMSPKKWMQL